MRQIADDVFALGTRGHNFYLLIDNGEVTIIDAGCSGEWGRLESGLKANGLSTDQVVAFAITHVHGDHFGLAKRASDESKRVAVHEADESRALGTYEGRFSAESSDINLFNPLALWNMLPMVFSGLSRLEFLDDVETFSDGQRLDVPGHPVVVHTPGHTEGHAMFHVEDRGLLFTGDGLATMNILGSSRGPQLMPPVFDLDPEQSARSLDRIVGLSADLILPGHGRPWAGTPAAAVELVRS